MKQKDPFIEAKEEYENKIFILNDSIKQSMNNLFICGDLREPYYKTHVIYGINMRTGEMLGFTHIKKGNELITTRLDI